MHDEDENSEADSSGDDDSGPALRVQPEGLRALLHPGHLPAPGDEPEDAAESALASKLKRASRRHTLTAEHTRSMQTGARIWQTAQAPHRAGHRSHDGNRYQDQVAEHIAAKRQIKRQQGDSAAAPFDKDRHAAATWHRDAAASHLDAVMRVIRGLSLIHI